MEQTETAPVGRQPRNKAGEPERDDDLLVIREQTRETLALMRQLIELLLPKGDPEKPKLEDLIAALIAQQARTLMVCQQISTDIQGLIERSAPESGGQLNGHKGANGALRS